MRVGILELAAQAKTDGVETALGYYVKKLPWAEFAYLHEIKKPATPEVRSEVGTDLAFPSSLVAHFEHCNGGALFMQYGCVGIYLFGCNPRNQLLNRSAGLDHPPIDIRVGSRLYKDEIRIGSYGLDGSSVFLRRADETIRCCVGRDVTQTRMEWRSVDEWLDSEIGRFSLHFSPDGAFVGKEEDLLPRGKIAPPKPTLRLKNAPQISLPQEYAMLRGKRQWDDLWVTIFPVSAVSQEQVGYRFHPSGKSLIGGPGNWKEEWIVIGRDNFLGDPIFIDTAKSGLPVFTAEHGQGVWEPDLIACSCEVFFNSLDAAQAVLAGKLTMEQAQTRVAEMNRNHDVNDEFWTVLMESD